MDARQPGRPKLHASQVRRVIVTMYANRDERDRIHAAYCRDGQGILFAAWMREITMHRVDELLKRKKRT